MTDEAAHDVVECAPKVQGKFADIQRPFAWRLPFDVEDVLRNVRFMASEDATAYVVNKGAPFMIERGKSFVCALEPKERVL